jgi:hypothetical protein
VDGGEETLVAAFGCLRELLVRLARVRPVVLAIDDVHLGGADEARRLAGLATVPGLHFVLTHDEDARAAPVVAELRRAGVEVCDVVLGPIADDEARALARRILPPDLPRVDEVAAAIAAAAEGSPLAVEELSIHRCKDAVISIDEAVVARLAGLGAPAMRLAEVAATVRRALPRALLLEVAGLGAAGEPTLAALAGCRVLRAEGPDDADLVRVHDARIQAILAVRLPAAAARRIHLDLAKALAARPVREPAAVAACFEHGGAPDLAAGHLGEAARRAAAGGDHDAAAELLGRAVAVVPRGTVAARDLSGRRAEALAAAGRSAEAAAAWLEGDAGDPIDRRCWAAEHLLLAGRADEGLAHLRAVLAARGLAWPWSRSVARWVLRARVLELRVRGTNLGELGPPPSAHRAPPRFAAAWAAARGLSVIDPLRSALFLTEALLAALAAGDGRRAAPALAFLGSVLVTLG